jgi:hypothetical protein
MRLNAGMLPLHFPLRRSIPAHTRCLAALSTARRHPAFDDAFVVGSVLGDVLRAARATHVAVLAYCFVPDQLLLCLEATPHSATVPAYLQFVKTRSDHAYRQASGGPLWQPDHRLRHLRPTDDARAQARALVQHPVRIGLTRHLGRYPHVGSTVWSREELLRTD